MIDVHVTPGICGLETHIQAQSADSQQVQLTIESKCPHIAALQEPLAEVDGYGIVFAPFSQSPVYQAAEQNFKHAACPVPAAIIKAVEAACNLALPKDVHFEIKKS